ncbi:hypothetical protein NMY3_02182 [Candidatus Nitrosocosmicus oleophilus]|uniref:Uncharacterized protein n=1 Tax=Candidatus Nitrosocosmicus oleophilus TaxID=1353260 RepID=A0A654MA77_9ARCH|nr:hypothetical protein NMY3_02182 [Candidatus Nitrosocosmicus oleophilus]
MNAHITKLNDYSDLEYQVSGMIYIVPNYSLNIIFVASCSLLSKIS